MIAVSATEALRTAGHEICERRRPEPIAVVG
jgi:hypothetical protein